MIEPTTALGTVALAAIGVAATVALRGPPGPKRRHLFEDEDGERANPFAAISADAAAAQDHCRRCGGPIESSTYRFCAACETAGRPGD